MLDAQSNLRQLAHLLQDCSIVSKIGTQSPLSEPAPETESQVLESLVAKLSDDSKELYYKAIATTKSHEEQRWRNTKYDFQQIHLDEDEDLSIEEILKSNASLVDVYQEPLKTSATPTGIESQEPTQEGADMVWKQFNESLDDATREQFGRAQGYWRNGELLASFDRDWAKNWVCKHAFELGWSEQLFGNFEKTLSFDGRDLPRIERIGKKHQRIAFYKFLAHLADNVHYKDDAGYSDAPKPSRYRGPWQLWDRDIDPTHWMRKTSESEWGEWGANVWWRPVTIQDDFDADDAWQIKTPHAVPYAQYEWEQGSGDQSAEMNLSLYLPSSFLIKKLNLDFDRNSFNRWTNKSGQTVLFDPSLEFDGTSFALFDCRAIDSMLSNSNSVLVWLIGGEKMIINSEKNRLEARMIYNSMLWTTGDGNIQSTVRHYME